MSISRIDMERATQHYDFASDNTAAICPEAWSALEAANHHEAPSYGDDLWTAKLCDRVRELFETECDVYLIQNGTAANALALAQVCQSFQSIICHENAHIHTDECGAPEFFTNGSKLVTVGGENGKIDIGEVETALARHRDLHSHMPQVISVTQATEFGTVYTREEIARVSELARKQKMILHMDGARFANAIASRGCSPKEMTWRAGVDILCFGGTKNGLSAGELVIFFDKELGRDFDHRLKQGGQLASKMRFLTAPWIGLLTGDVWLKNARLANAGAQKLAEILSREANVPSVFPVEANAVFFRMPEPIMNEMNKRGWHCYKFIEPDIYRAMCAWSIEESAIREFVVDLKAIAGSFA